ncbi:SDR family NAD(P)-dependent oxidoreductase, partial [Corynebacterium stationis]|uniref:SDR family NAD(P)-dependent oxidoreductase n=1 Tax=Corynebacterium stationis TaxID=1705 RepID=UPI0017679688
MAIGPQLEGKVVVVTGGASGIGAAVAELFGEHGASVAVVDLNAEKAQRTVENILSQRGTAKAWSLDVTDGAATAKVMDEVTAEFGGIDVLVTAAGILDQQDFLEMSEETFDRTIGIDLK